MKENEKWPAFGAIWTSISRRRRRRGCVIATSMYVRSLTRECWERATNPEPTGPIKPLESQFRRAFFRSDHTSGKLQCSALIPPRSGRHSLADRALRDSHMEMSPRDVVLTDLSLSGVFRARSPEHWGGHMPPCVASASRAGPDRPNPAFERCADRILGPGASDRTQWGPQTVASLIWRGLFARLW